MYFDWMKNLASNSTLSYDSPSDATFIRYVIGNFKSANIQGRF